jgi:hypothetical protein
VGRKGPSGKARAISPRIAATAGRGARFIGKEPPAEFRKPGRRWSQRPAVPRRQSGGICVFRERKALRNSENWSERGAQGPIGQGLRGCPRIAATAGRGARFIGKDPPCRIPKIGAALVTKARRTPAAKRGICVFGKRQLRGIPKTGASAGRKGPLGKACAVAPALPRRQGGGVAFSGEMGTRGGPFCQDCKAGAGLGRRGWAGAGSPKTPGFFRM